LGGKGDDPGRDGEDESDEKERMADDKADVHGCGM
jgi:hypothetical protein